MRTLVPGYVFVYVARNVTMSKHVVERRLDFTYSTSGLCKPMSSSSRPSPTPSPRWRLHCGRNRKRRSVVERGGDEHEVGGEVGQWLKWSPTTLHNQNLILTLLQKALVADVAATRELCVQLDKTKDSLSRQLASQSISYEQVGNHCWDIYSSIPNTPKTRTPLYSGCFVLMLHRWVPTVYILSSLSVALLLGAQGTDYLNKSFPTLTSVWL